jgi:outer membrane receptor for ferrienterochelin and colicin
MEMPVETHLVRVADNATPAQIEGILKALLKIGGHVNVIANKSIITTFDSDYSDVIKHKPGVLLVGGVNFRGRTVRKVIKRRAR